MNVLTDQQRQEAENGEALPAYGKPESMAQACAATKGGPMLENEKTMAEAKPIPTSETAHHDDAPMTAAVDETAWGHDSANQLQVGGDHYKIGGEEHWDRQYRLHGPGYHVGCATKYAERHLQKDGVNDLIKGIHYLYKLAELELADPKIPGKLKALTPSAAKILTQLRKAGKP